MTDSPENSGTRPGERIAKLLARAGVASRREVERMIAEGRVRLNDAVLTTPATVLPDLRGVTVDGKPVRAAEPTRLFLFHKPSGLITAERDPKGKPTIYTALRNALPQGTPRVMPVGRLDLNTEGLLLLTNDGELKRALELPASGVPRTYRARTFGDITQARLEELIEGIQIGDIRYGAIDANMERRTGRNQWIELTLSEGKNREVRRVLEFLGLEVSRLLRTAYGPFRLGDLPRGSAWEVPSKTVEVFRKVLLEGGKALAPVFAPPMEAMARPAEPKLVPARPAAPPRGSRGAARRPDAAARTNGDRRAPSPRTGAPEPTGRTARPTRPTRPTRPREDEGELLGRSELRAKRAADRSASSSHQKRGPGDAGAPRPHSGKRPGKPGPGKPRGRRP